MGFNEIGSSENFEQQNDNTEKLERVEDEVAEQSLARDSFDDNGDETLDANNPNDEESTDSKAVANQNVNEQGNKINKESSEQQNPENGSVSNEDNANHDVSTAESGEKNDLSNYEEFDDEEFDDYVQEGESSGLVATEDKSDSESDASNIEGEQDIFDDDLDDNETSKDMNDVETEESANNEDVEATMEDTFDDEELDDDIQEDESSRLGETEDKSESESNVSNIEGEQDTFDDDTTDETSEDVNDADDETSEDSAEDTSDFDDDTTDETSEDVNDTDEEVPANDENVEDTTEDTSDFDDDITDETSDDVNDTDEEVSANDENVEDTTEDTSDIDDDSTNETTEDVDNTSEKEPADDETAKDNADDTSEPANNESETTENSEEQPKKFEDYTMEELRSMSPEEVNALNADYRERYEAESLGMTQEEYQDYKDRLDANQSKEDMDKHESSKSLEDVEKEKSMDARFDDIEQRVMDFRQDFKDGYGNSSDEKKALGANMNTIHDIDGLRSDIQAEKEAAWNKMAELKNENPYYDHTNNAEYKEAADKYLAMESMENKLNGWEAELDGKNYAMAEELGLPYYQQTEHYHESRDQRLDKMETYFNGADGNKDNGISSKLENGSTEPLDKFQFEFQKDRMQSALDDIKENGTPEQKARAEKLSEQLNKAENDFKQVHNEYSLNKDGTTTKKVDTYHSAKTFNVPDANIERKDGGTKNIHTELNFGGKHVTEKGENILYTGESTGKSSKTVTHEGVNLKSTTKETGVDKHGEAYKKESTAQVTALKAEYGYSRDDGKMKYDAKADASLLNLSVSSEKETEGGTKTVHRAEANVGHVKASASADMKSGEYKASAEATKADGKISASMKDKEGNSVEFAVEGKVGSVSASAGFDKYGPDVKVKTTEASVAPSVKVNGVDVLPGELKPEAKGSETIFKHQPMKDVKTGFEGLDKAEKLSDVEFDNLVTDAGKSELKKEGVDIKKENEKTDAVEIGERSYFLSDSSYQRFVKGELKLGREELGKEALFSFPKEEADKLLADSKGSRSYIEKKAGLEKGRFGDGPIHRIDIKYPEEHNLRMASGMDPGSNCFFNTPNPPDVSFVKKDSGIESITLKNGEKKDIDYTTDPGKTGKVIVGDAYFEVIDDTKTSSSDLEKLNGRYVTLSGEVHMPNTENYPGKTSGGISEAVTDRIPNQGVEVHHTTLIGGHREPEGLAVRIKEHLSDNSTGGKERENFRVIDNYTGLYDAVNTYQDTIKSVDSEDISFEEKTRKVNDIHSQAVENIQIDRDYDDTENRKMSGVAAIDEAQKNKYLESLGYDEETAKQWYDDMRKHYLE